MQDGRKCILMIFQEERFSVLLKTVNYMLKSLQELIINKCQCHNASRNSRLM